MISVFPTAGSDLGPPRRELARQRAPVLRRGMVFVLALAAVGLSAWMGHASHAGATDAELAAIAASAFCAALAAALAAGR